MKRLESILEPIMLNLAKLYPYNKRGFKLTSLVVWLLMMFIAITVLTSGFGNTALIKQLHNELSSIGLL